MTPLEQLFYLIDEYRANRYSTEDFEYYFSTIYCHELYSDTLESKTKDYFKSIILLLSRYSRYEEDLKNFKDFFIDETTFRDKFNKLVIEYETK